MSSSSACAATIAVTPDGSTSAESMTSGSSGSTPCTRMGRKRVRTPSRWKRTVKKKRRNSGQEYVSTSKATVSLTHTCILAHTCTHTTGRQPISLSHMHTRTHTHTHTGPVAIP